MKVYLVRHGESWFNRRYGEQRVDPGLRDPSLTAEGAAAAERLAATLTGAGIEHILASPFTRALQTATLLAARLGAPVFVDAALRERRYFECDVGTERGALLARWPGLTFHPFEEQWWASGREIYADFVGRTREALCLLEAWAARGVVCAVTHSGVIEALSGAELQTGEARAYSLHELRDGWAARRAAAEEARRAL